MQVFLIVLCKYALSDFLREAVEEKTSLRARMLPLLAEEVQERPMVHWRKRFQRTLVVVISQCVDFARRWNRLRRIVENPHPVTLVDVELHKSYVYWVVE